MQGFFLDTCDLCNPCVARLAHIDRRAAENLCNPCNLCSSGGACVRTVGRNLCNLCNLCTGKSKANVLKPH